MPCNAATSWSLAQRLQSLLSTPLCAVQKRPVINIYGGIGGYEARAMALDYTSPLPPLRPTPPSLSLELLSHLPGYKAMLPEASTVPTVPTLPTVPTVPTVLEAETESAARYAQLSLLNKPACPQTC